MTVEFDPFSGAGVDVLETVRSPCVDTFKMTPPLAVLCVSQGSQGDTRSVSVMRLYGPGDREVARATQEMLFVLPLAVVVVDRNNVSEGRD